MFSPYHAAGELTSALIWQFLNSVDKHFGLAGTFIRTAVAKYPPTHKIASIDDGKRSPRQGTRDGGEQCKRIWQRNCCSK